MRVVVVVVVMVMAMAMVGEEEEVAFVVFLPSRQRRGRGSRGNVHGWTCNAGTLSMKGSWTPLTLHPPP